MSGPDRLLVVGLGNPGRHYRGNRHNVGFMFIDAMAKATGLSVQHAQSNALIGLDDRQAPRLILAKPQTYVNESGRAVASLVRSFKVELSDLLVVFDDLDLPLGRIRMRPFGGSSGHRGMRSVINHLGDSGFPRLRIGIGRPPAGIDAARYVLSDFKPPESPELESAFERGVSCVKQAIDAGIEIAMNECNANHESV